MKSIIRKATAQDLASILALNKALFVFEEEFTDTYNPTWTYAAIGKNYFSSRIKNEKAITSYRKQGFTDFNLILETNIL